MNIPLKINIFIIVYLTIFNFKICSGANFTLVDSNIVVSSQPNTNFCLVTTIIKISGDLLLSITDITVAPPFIGPLYDNKVVAFSQSTIDNQIFILKNQLAAGANVTMVININNIPSSFSGTVSPPKSVYCDEMHDYNFVITERDQLKPQSTSNSLSTFVYFNISQEGKGSNINCVVDPPLNCFMGPQVSIYSNIFVMNLILDSSYTSLNPKFNVTLTPFLYAFDPIVLEIESPFPWSVNRTSKVTEIVNYPPSGYTIADDYRLKSYQTNNFFTYVTIENMNSLLSTPAGYFTLVMKNATHSKFALYTQVSQYGSSGTNDLYFLDSNATKITTLEYNVIKSGLPSDLSYEIISDITNGFKYVQFTKTTPYMFNYVFSSSKSAGQKYELSTPSLLAQSYVNYTIAIPFNFNASGIMAGSFIPDGASTLVTFPTETITPSKIVINSISYIPMSFSYIVTINISSVYPVTSILFSNNLINVSSLVDGDLYNGIFQSEVTVRAPTLANIFIYDIIGTSQFSQEGLPLNDKFMIFPSPPSIDSSKLVLGSDLDYMRFEKTDIDLSNGPVNNTLYFNVTKYNPNIIPTLIIDNFGLRTFYGAYNYDLKLFEVNFTIPTWMITSDIYGVTDYLGIGIPIISGQYVYSLFNSNPSTLLNIINTRDQSSPMVKSLEKYRNSLSFGWIMNISYPIDDGFKSGYISVVSQYHSLPFVVNFNASNRIFGDEFFGTYNVSLDISVENCKSQIFTLDSVNLGNPQPYYVFESLSGILGTEYEQNINHSHICIGTLDTDLPILVSLSFNSTVQVGGFDRPIEIVFTTTDVGTSGISTKYIPYIYLSSENEQNFKIPSILISNNGTHFNYVAKGQMPYGFGLTTIFVSVYGISDNHNNYNAYTFLDLKSKSFPYFMKRELDLKTPYLYSHSPILETGGILTIHGNSMGLPSSTLKTKVDLLDGNGYHLITPTLNSSIIIHFNVGQFKSEYIKVQIEVDGILSNELKVYPLITYKINPPPVAPTQSPSSTPSPTPTSTSSPKPPTSLCPGNPQCNNRGICKPNVGCQCDSPWFGPSCDSQNKITPPPSPQPEPTIGTNTTGKANSLITSMIQIIEVREIDNVNNIINRYGINHWNLTDLSKTSLNPTYSYTAQLNQTSTIINITIIFFVNETNITYGSETLNMLPSTIKFSIEVSKYEFKSKTNLLQIVMESTIKGSNGDSCSSEQFGSQNNTKDNIQWIKMNIDDSSLYGRFIDFGIIDGREQAISNRIIEEDESEDNLQYRSMKVGITVPYYEKSIYLDPDFSNLIDVTSNDSNLQCESKKKLSSGAIAGIVVGSVVFASLVIGGSLYIHKKIKRANESKRISAKLKNMAKDK